MESKDEYIFILCLLFVIKMEICKLQGQILERIVQADFDICKRNLNICEKFNKCVFQQENEMLIQLLNSKYRVIFFTGTPPKKFKCGKPRLGESTLT